MQLGLSPRRCGLRALWMCGLLLASATGTEPARLTVERRPAAARSQPAALRHLLRGDQPRRRGRYLRRDDPEPFVRGR